MPVCVWIYAMDLLCLLSILTGFLCWWLNENLLRPPSSCSYRPIWRLILTNWVASHECWLSNKLPVVQKHHQLVKQPYKSNSCTACTKPYNCWVTWFLHYWASVKVINYFALFPYSLFLCECIYNNNNLVFILELSTLFSSCQWYMDYIVVWVSVDRLH